MAADGAPVRLREEPFPRQLGIRVAPGSAAAGRVERVLGAVLPTEPNTVCDGVLWLGPDEWLAVGLRADEGEVRAALAGEGAAVELSANRTALVLSGPAAPDVLASCCALDLHPRAFGPGRCAQTLVAGVPVVLEALDAAPTYRLLVRPSFAAHVAAWLRDAIEAPGGHP